MRRDPGRRRVVVKCAPACISARRRRHRPVPGTAWPAMFRPSLGDGRRKRQTQDGRR
jgi:hypothetical protein